MGEARNDGRLLGVLGLLFLAAMLAAPINHDESQYVAAVALMRHGLPYRDWPYLQTPLQPLLLSPLALLPAGWLLLAARLANVLFALVTCWALLRILKDRVPARAAHLAVAAMAATNAFLFGTEVARNDMLPVALLSLGMLALLPVNPLPLPLPARRAAVAGLCFGLAISAKISLALPVAGAGLWIVWRGPELGWSRLLLAACGGVAGLLPSLAFYALAPGPFIFGVFTYSLQAPQQFWSAVGHPEMLSPLYKLGELGLEMLAGATAVALGLWLADLRRSTVTERLLDLMVAGGLLAAFLPDPFFRQYLIPLLPPLFVRIALVLPRLGGRRRLLVLGTGALTAAIGASGSLVAVATALPSPPIFEAVARGRRVAEAGRPIVTLSPEQVVGADVGLDPRFAAGPFLFRTHGDLGRTVQAVTGVPTFQTFSEEPDLILTGGERKPRPPLFPRGLDAVLDDHAQRRAYIREELGSGYVLWRHPRNTALR